MLAAERQVVHQVQLERVRDVAWIAGLPQIEHGPAQRHRFHEPSSTITHSAGCTVCRNTLSSVRRAYFASSRQGVIKQ